MSTYEKNLEVFASREVCFRGTRFWIKQTRRTPDGTTIAFAQPLTFKDVGSRDIGAVQPEAFILGDEDSQSFIDELWRVGFRPTEGTGSAGSLAATERHLADMRALVFKTAKP